MYRLEDLDLMREALRLAGEGTGLASPNPRVGAVIVRDGAIVGRGTHTYAGLKHAEVLAIEEAGEAARGATLYLNLEPCCHEGRTGPCTAAVIGAGITRVVAGMSDPNPRVAGAGFRELEMAGIRVESGCMGREAERLNEDFATWIRSGRPFVTLKAAASLDGRIAAASDVIGASTKRDGSGMRSWVSSEPARERVQQMRHERDAVLTGIGTVLADDPLLSDRTKKPRRRPLLKVIVDSELRTPATASLLKHARRLHDVIIFHARGSGERQRELEKAGARVVAAARDGGEHVDVGAALKQLGDEGVISVLLEAGSKLNGTMLREGRVDKIVLFQAPLLLGEKAPALMAGAGEPGKLPRRVLGPLSCETVGPDVMIEAYFSEADAE